MAKVSRTPQSIKDELHALDNEPSQREAAAERLRAVRAKAEAYRATRPRVFAPIRPPEIHEADELLRELMWFFEIENARRSRAVPLQEEQAGALVVVGVGSAVDGDEDRRTRLALGNLPDDPVERSRIYDRERIEALPVLREIVGLLRRSRRKAEVEEAWTVARDRWNEAVKVGRWMQLPPLCEWCGKPVLLRKVTRIGDDWQVPKVCDEECGERLRERNRAPKRKERRALG